MLGEMLSEVAALVELPPRVAGLAADLAGFKAEVKARLAKLEAAPPSPPPPPPPPPPAVPPPPPIDAVAELLARPAFDPLKNLVAREVWRVPNANADFGVTGLTTAFDSNSLAVRENADGTRTFLFGAARIAVSVGPGGDPAKPTTAPLLKGIGNFRDAYQLVKDWDFPGDTTTNDKDPAQRGVGIDGDWAMVSGRNGYATPVPSDPFIVRKHLVTGEIQGPFGLTGGLCQVYGGGDLCRIPQEIADLLFDGMDLAAGGGLYESGQGSTAGPSLLVFRSAALARMAPAIAPIFAERSAALAEPADTDEAKAAKAAKVAEIQARLDKASRLLPGDFRELIRFGPFGGVTTWDRERRPPDYSTPIWSPAPVTLPDGTVEGYIATDRHLAGPTFIGGKCPCVVYSTVQGVGDHLYSRQGETFTGSNQARRWYVYPLSQLKEVFDGKRKPFECRGKWFDFPPLPGGARPDSPVFRVEGLEWVNGSLYALWRWVWGGNSEWWPAVVRYDVL